MLFGGGNPAADENTGGTMDANELLEMMASGNTNAIDEPIVDEAIVVEFEDTEVKNNQPSKPGKDQADGTQKKANTKNKPADKNTDLTEDDRAILNAAQQKPLWVQEDRIIYEKHQMFEVFKKEEEINFELFDKDYLSVFEVFSQNAQLPFGLEKELNK